MEWNAFGVAERLMRYVQIDTQSDPNSHSFPSTEKQKDLSKLLLQELLEIGIVDATMDTNGYVMATIPATIESVGVKAFYNTLITDIVIGSSTNSDCCHLQWLRCYDYSSPFLVKLLPPCL